MSTDTFCEQSQQNACQGVNIRWSSVGSARVTVGQLLRNIQHAATEIQIGALVRFCLVE